ncbi:hypothetical protein T492DRAFT_1019780 [Pavlovales sp. CCMP2436]|nr:hypothetical protein T492DRAFT_1019780 [Pavlovales sp. CCMP2436]
MMRRSEWRSIERVADVCAPSASSPLAAALGILAKISEPRCAAVIYADSASMVIDARVSLDSLEVADRMLPTDVILVVPTAEKGALDARVRSLLPSARVRFHPVAHQDTHVFTVRMKAQGKEHLVFCVFGRKGKGKGKRKRTSADDLVQWMTSTSSSRPGPLDFVMLEGAWAHAACDEQLKGLRARARIFSGCSHVADAHADLDPMDAGAQAEFDLGGGSERASGSESDTSAPAASSVEQPPLGRRKRKRVESSGDSAAEARLLDASDWHKLHRLYDVWPDELRRYCSSDLQLVWQRYNEHLRTAASWSLLGADARCCALKDADQFERWLSELGAGHTWEREIFKCARDPCNQARYRKLLAAPPRGSGPASVLEPGEVWDSLCTRPWFLAAGIAPVPCET